MLESAYWGEHRALLEGAQAPEREMTAILFTHSEPASWGSLAASLTNRKPVVHVALFEPDQAEAVLDVPVLEPTGEVPLDVPVTVRVTGVVEVGHPLLVTAGEITLVSSNPPTSARRFTPRLSR